MSTARMQSRFPTAIPKGIGFLKDYEFVCPKKSYNGSGKGNLRRSENDEAWRVLFLIIESDLLQLEQIEGGYRRENVEVIMDNKQIKTVTHISDRITNEPPYQSYLQHIIDGAAEHHLPEE